MHTTPALIESEDEWNDMAQRFKKEGIDFQTLSLEHKMLHVWRWLVDAEINLKNSRRMLDKLHEQQHEEIEEMENYVGKIKNQVEKQKETLKDETWKLEQQVNGLKKLLDENKIQCDNVLDAVQILIIERNQFLNELEVLKTAKFSFYDPSKVGNDSEQCQADEMLAEIIKVSSERELLKRQVTEMNDRIELLEKSARQSELDNEKLAYKLSETLAELEDKEELLGEPQFMCIRSHSNSNRSTLIRSDTSKSLPLEMLDTEQCSTGKDRDAVTDFTCSINLPNRDMSHSFGADSTPPSLLVSELQSFGSPRKLTSLLDSCNELARIEEMKRLQSECDTLRNHITLLGEKYNTLALRHIQYKSKRKFQIEELRGRLDAGQCQIETLQSQLSVQRQRLRAEEMFRKQVETDYRRLQEEKRNIAARLLNTEMDQREMQRELSILHKKINLLDNTNSELLARLLRLKYREGIGIGLTKSTTCDNMTSNINFDNL